MEDLNGRVAVVTGGASGVGKGVAKALLGEGARSCADIEQGALDTAVAELSASAGSGIVTDVSDSTPVDVLAEQVYVEHGACHLLFNNAEVTSGGGGKPWEQEPNDWKWCLGVNVFGVVNGVLAFVPPHARSGEPGRVINTSSGDGGFAPVPHASVYATSTATVSCVDRGLAHSSSPRPPGAGHRLLPVRRPARHGPVDRATQPARGAACQKQREAAWVTTIRPQTARPRPVAS